MDGALADMEEFSDLDSLEFFAVGDLVNKTFDALNAAWLCMDNNAAYPQPRMEHFFDIIGKALCRFIQRKLEGTDIWSTQTGDARIKLQAAVKICEQWCEVPRKLTNTFCLGVNTPGKEMSIAMVTWKRFRRGFQMYYPS